ncbi:MULTISPECIES: Zn-dependent hydrolase [Brenneria]|uniref:Zn-dependent hydrolase n=1 Tax=Brenneria nigrifluens DSM 30175 = ATCC 13028 TaxID=1121120 RepID=A0A2U1USX3_9GAMM|nr:MULTISPECIES: Zn-dependent hydrolase [Brenneria]EHD21714.1 amidase, hydantoinase/carbamoylase family [Brenneria sp. EniD312]PWC24750.1 Zn-dependent hydrolase [Brenneria nigrifluens] [Brenneria nigrifluens DSM 30175 = ATCC 13028]QCR04827.1 Zn-dependent hydrolase [Brenneria nigrifluens] [Brenneria nigrifluens DSM 30175 = ATCC 13028]
MLQANGERLWNSLMEMAKIGATDAGGNTRLALTKEDKLGRKLFIQWCRDAGMSIYFDPIGNLFARREGKNPQVNPIVMGSHLDTQPKGGRFDGIYGVLAGLEVIRTLNDKQIITEQPLEIAVWTNEEGARFTPAMLGSAVFTGALALEKALDIADRDGVSIRQSLADIGHAGNTALARPFDAYYEAHIEQGPVLEEEGIPIGVVTGGQGICWLDIDVVGVSAHAGTTPMKSRFDPLFGVGEMLMSLESSLSKDFPGGLFTIGQVEIPGSSRNTIPSRVKFTLDLRNPDDRGLAAMETSVRRQLTDIAAARGLTLHIERHWLSPATHFDDRCVATVRSAVQELGYAWREIISGAGHDAINIAKHCPTTMIFIPCVGGISHNESEAALPDDVTKGCDVLLNAVLLRAA